MALAKHTAHVKCAVAGASAPGLEIRSNHKGTLVKQLLQEGELITESGTRRGECVVVALAAAACAAAAALPLLLPPPPPLLPLLLPPGW